LLSAIELSDAEQLEKRRSELIVLLAKLERDGTMRALYAEELGGKPVVVRGKRQTRMQQN
jgi:hypothetical protein